MKNQGFTLIELLIAVTIVAVMTILGATQFRTAQTRARDAQRKNNLDTIRRAFEDYYNDHGCYPPVGSLKNCGSGDLEPYLLKVPCDPTTKDPYEYVPLANACSGYRVYTQLRNENDEDIARVGCAEGCGYTVNPDYNYGVAAGTTVYYTE